MTWHLANKRAQREHWEWWDGDSGNKPGFRVGNFYYPTNIYYYEKSCPYVRKEIHYAPTVNQCQEMFGKTARDIEYYLTYSRRCTHPWSDGACDDCPNYL